MNLFKTATAAPAPARIVVMAIHDSMAEAFSNPYFFPAEGAGIRAFAQGVNGGDKAMTANPGDFTLYRLGTYDERTGVLVPETDPVRVVTGLQVNQKAPQ